MQERWIADRAMLQQLIQKHPEWTQQELADWIGRSLGWVKKWVKRLREAPQAQTCRAYFGAGRNPDGFQRYFHRSSCRDRQAAACRRSFQFHRRRNLDPAGCAGPVGFSRSNSTASCHPFLAALWLA